MSDTTTESRPGRPDLKPSPNAHLIEIILTRAKLWNDRSCRETVTNGGSCIDDVHREFTQSENFRRQMYCAEFVYVLYWESCMLAHLHPLLPRTAGSRNMLDLAMSEQLLRVDTTPQLGSVFYRKSMLKNRKNEVTGHCGIVYSIDENSDKAYMISIEGNYSDRITFVKNARSRVEDPGNGFRFIHTEESWVPMWYASPPVLPV